MIRVCLPACLLLWTKANEKFKEDQRSIGNRLAAQENSSNPDKPSASRYNPEAELSKKNPEAPAVFHGHEPSKGAKVDHDLQADDEQRLREKGIK